MADNNEFEAYRKLERIKDIRTKMVHLEKLKSKLQNAVGTVDLEDKCLEEYKAELDFLLQEKMAHVEELRLINADINLLETTIKQAEEEKNKAVENIRHLVSNCTPLQAEIDMLRVSLGLDPQPDTTLGEQQHFIERILEKQITEPRHHANGMETDSAGQSSMSLLQSLPATLPSHNSNVDSRQPTSVPLMLRQQPPPMKACLSCHQQIHRNAPICPLCKAKSRSRNPKKAKRKALD